MKNTTISVVINTYCHHLYIEACIDSVEAQGYTGEMELVVVDDGSPPATQQLIRERLARITRFPARLIVKPNGGQASALNQGWQEARGDILCFLDGDDTFRPEKLEVIANWLQQHPDCQVIGHGINQFSLTQANLITVRTPSTVQVNDPESARMFCRIRPLFGTSRLVMRRQAATRLFPIPESLRFEADEYLFTQAALALGVTALPDILTNYRLHDNNLYMLKGFDLNKVAYKHGIIERVVDLNTKLIFAHLPMAVAEPVTELINAANQKTLANLGIYLGKTDQATAQKYQLGKRHWAYRWFGARGMHLLMTRYAALMGQIKQTPATIYLT